MTTSVNIFDLDVTPSTPAPQLTARQRTAAEQASKEVYFTAKAKGATDADAKAAAERAFTRTAEATAPEAAPQNDTERAIDNRAELVAAGWAPALPLYTIGTAVNETGVANGRKARREYDAKPTVGTACTRLIDRVRAESREDTVVDLRDWRMGRGGDLATGPGPVETRKAWTNKLALEPSGFKGLVGRLPCSGGSTYLASCPTELRARNVNHWLGALASDAGKATLRTRKTTPVDGVEQPERAAYAVVSDKYTAFDADKVAEAVALAMPADAKATVNYDGGRVSIDVHFASTVEPAHFVAGEIFRAGIRIRTADDGSGAIRVSATVWQNLCMNLIVLDKMLRRFGSIRHMGTVEDLAMKLRAALREALQSLDAILASWGYAVESKAGNDDRDLVRKLNALLETKTVDLGARNRELVLARLVDAHRSDVSSAVQVHPVSRASIVNAFTRFAHTELTDPWAQDEVERSAGAILTSKAALPTVDLTDEIVERVLRLTK